MGEQYAGDEDFFPVDYTIPDDSDPPTAAAFNPAAEALGDRTAWLKKRVDALVPLPSLAALMAITSVQDGTPRLVEVYGWYVYEAASTVEVKSPWVLAADDSPGTGRWIRAGMHRRKMNRTFGAARPHLVSAHNATRAKGAGFYQAQIPGVSAGVDHVSNGFYTVNGAGIFNYQPAASTTMGVMWDITDLLIEGATLEKVQAIVQPAPGRAALPTTPISIGVFVSDPVTASMTSLRNDGDFVNDPAATFGAYENLHILHYTTNQNNVVSKAYQSYFVQIWNEFGSNVLASNKINGLYVLQKNVADLTWGDDY